MKQAPVKPAAIELELVDKYVDCTLRCRVCDAAFSKTTFKDGDSEFCSSCGVEHRFEILGDEVVAHKVENAATRLQTIGVMLGVLLRG